MKEFKINFILNKEKVHYSEFKYEFVKGSQAIDINQILKELNYKPNRTHIKLNLYWYFIIL